MLNNVRLTLFNIYFTLTALHCSFYKKLFIPQIIIQVLLKSIGASKLPTVQDW